MSQIDQNANHPQRLQNSTQEELSSLVRVAKILRPHGLGGNLKILPYGEVLERVFFENIDAHPLPMIICNDLLLSLEQIKKIKNGLIVKFLEINDIDQAENFRNKHLLVNRHHPTLKTYFENQILVDDLIGFTVKNDQAIAFATIDSYYLNGRFDGLYQIKVTNSKMKDQLKKQQSDFFVPVKLKTFTDIDLSQGTLRIRELDLYWW